MKQDSLFSELPSITKFLSGAISGAGITIAVLDNSSFLCVAALGIMLYAFIIGRERAKKKSPNLSGDS